MGPVSRSAMLSHRILILPRMIAFLDQAAYLHDIGEVVMGRDYIPSYHSSADERLDLQRHPVIGEQEIAKLGLPRGVQLLVRWHHEWWNGLGLS